MLAASQNKCLGRNSIKKINCKLTSWKSAIVEAPRCWRCDLWGVTLRCGFKGLEPIKVCNQKQWSVRRFAPLTRASCSAGCRLLYDTPRFSLMRRARIPVAPTSGRPGPLPRWRMDLPWREVARPLARSKYMLFSLVQCVKRRFPFVEALHPLWIERERKLWARIVFKPP
jgi:hypothetical protein